MRLRKGLRSKIYGTLAGVLLLFGFLVLVLASQLIILALREQMNQRGSTIARIFSDGAAGPIIGNNVLELHALIAKYALLEDVAYVYVQDRSGKVIAHSLGSFPVEILVPGIPIDELGAHLRELTLQGRPVRETSVPILGGRAGSAHVGIWQDAVQGEILRVLLPLIGGIAVLLLVGLAVVIFLSRRIARPILRLTRMAENMSTGDLDTPIHLNANDEIGDLARSLERMRASLKAAMARLSREQGGAHASKDSGEENDHAVA